MGTLCCQSGTYTTGALGTATDTVNYTYGDTEWGDLLTAYDGQTITHDEIGNPLSDGKRTYTWEHGRELATITQDGKTWTNTYDASGLRTKRTDGTTTYRYLYTDGLLATENIGDDVEMWFMYDDNGPMVLKYNTIEYHYELNLQGDVVAIIDTAGKRVVEYTYDAWGNVLTITGSLADTVGKNNPIRYRGYVYDSETGLYYCQSRYYDPEMGRWINADAFASTGQGVLGNNMFAYCANNPVSFTDPSGNMFIARGDLGVAPVGFSTAGFDPTGSFSPGSPGCFGRKITDFLTNMDESTVLKAEHFAFYKGAPVIKVPFMEKNAFSLGVIFMGSDVTDPNLVRHEYGHCVHLSHIGVLNYVSKVVVPSVIGFWSEVPMERYYSQPWEYIAEVLGGVNRTNYQYSKNAGITAFIYLLFTLDS